MSHVAETFISEQFERMAIKAYASLIKYQELSSMQNLVDYMTSVGFDHDSRNNQLTFWSRLHRSPRRARIIIDVATPQDAMISRHYKAVLHTPYFIAWYLDEDAVDGLNREMENAPDKVADARALLTDRANDQDPALRDGPLSISIPQ
jgi:hypothetical protein